MNFKFFYSQALLTFFIGLSTTVNCMSQTDSWDLTFPDNIVGVVEVHEQPRLSQFGYADWPYGPLQILNATKKIAVDKEKFIFLKLNGSLDDLTLLQELPAFDLWAHPDES